MIALRLWQLHFQFLIAFGTSWLDDNRQRVCCGRPFSVSCSVSLSGHEGHLKLLKLFCHFVGRPPPCSLACLQVSFVPTLSLHSSVIIALEFSHFEWFEVFVDFGYWFSNGTSSANEPAFLSSPSPPPSGNCQAASTSAFAQCEFVWFLSF